ncbi:hypothetical protein MLD38_034600 [Melastoma candidum]|nr:hypothetical protein MLD38_034600 [Melastoma candidum]
MEAADRVLRLLMLGRKCEMPLGLINCLSWDMGLPPDFPESVIPEFPDYFRVVNGGSGRGSLGVGVLELVCWSGDLAKSAIEGKVKKGRDSGRVEFEMQFSRGFETDKKMKKWFDDWQKVPYLSPYQSGCSLESKSEESEKWGVGFLHELLHLFISKKAEKDTALLVGEYFGIRSKFKRAMLCHPGIFYVSSKNRTHTVILREGFKRGSLVETHPLTNVRNKYIHLMNTVREDRKSVGVAGLTGQSGKVTRQIKQVEQEADKHGEGALQDCMSSTEADDDDADTDDESNDEADSVRRGGRSGSRKPVSLRGRMSRDRHSSDGGHSRKNGGDKPMRNLYMQKSDKFTSRESTRKESFNVSNARERLPGRSAAPRRSRSFTREKAVQN